MVRITCRPCRIKITIDDGSKSNLNQSNLFDALIITNETAATSSKKKKPNWEHSSFNDISINTHANDNKNNSSEGNISFPSNSKHNDICASKSNTKNFEKDENKKNLSDYDVSDKSLKGQHIILHFITPKNARKLHSLLHFILLKTKVGFVKHVVVNMIYVMNTLDQSLCFMIGCWKVTKSREDI